MNLDAYLTHLAPELCVIVGGCLALIVGVLGGAVRRCAPHVAVFSLVAAMVALATYGESSLGVELSGVMFSRTALLARCIALGMGLLGILVNFHVAADTERGEFFSMILFSIAGLMLTACANDLILLFFALELVSVPTYILVALSRTDQRASEAAVKYFFLGALAAAVTVYGFSFLYGTTGTTVLQDPNGQAIANHLRLGGPAGVYLIMGLVLAFAGLSFKIAAVPFHAYVPDVYEGAASSVTGLLGFLPKFAGFLALIKLMDVCHWDLPDALVWMLWVIAALTMTVGNVLALLQSNVKRILAYSSIAHSGYMLIGLLVGPAMGQGPMRDGIAALLFYIVVYGMMNLGAFAILAVLSVRGNEGETLDDLSGLVRRAPFLAVGLAVCAFSLMGFPPTAGFLGKVFLFSGALSVDASHPFHGPLIALVVIAVLNTAIGAAYYLRIAAACLIREPKAEHATVGGFPIRWAISVCCAAMLVLFIRPAALVNPARWATQQLHYNAPYASTDSVPENAVAQRD